MTVSSTVTLPAQPSTGQAIYHPLGGDGWLAPKAAFTVFNTLAMDASGGNSVSTIVFDSRFESILVLMQAHLTGGVAAAEFEAQLIQNPRIDSGNAGIRVRAFGTSIFLDALSDQNLWTWAPPLLVNQASASITTPNVDGDTVHQFAWIFMYNIRVFEKVPLNVILSSIPSIAGQTPPS